MADYSLLRKKIEAMIFVSGEGMSIREIAGGLGEDEPTVDTIVNSLMDEYAEREGGISIQEAGGKYRFSTSPAVFDVIRDFLREKKKNTLSRAMLETLAVITYRQPVTLQDIEDIRGVNSRSLVMGLLQKKLIKVTGQKDVPGKPSTYGTTREFLEYFGINSLQELPPPREIKELNFDEL